MSVPILGRVTGNSETFYLPSEKTMFSPSPERHWRQAAAQVSANPSDFFEVGSPSSERAADPRTLLAPCPHTTMHSGVWPGRHHRPQITRHARKTRRHYEKSKVYCKLYFASLRSSFLQDLLISMIFSQMYLLTLESLCAISVSSTVSCAILSYKHSRKGKETRRPRINGEFE